MPFFNHTSGTTLDINGAQIYYEDHGNKSAPVLLFLHGAMGSIEDFNNVISQIPYNNYRIIGIDSRGCGKSSLGKEKLTYALLQKDVESIVKHLGITKLSVIGFSNGGTVGYRLAAYSNLIIEKLITLGAPWSNQISEQLRKTFETFTPDLFKRYCPDDYEKFKKFKQEHELNLIFKNMIEMALDTSNQSRPNKEISKISCPVLALRGEHDPTISVRDLDKVKTLIKNSRIITIPNVGHDIIKTNPKEIAMILKEFLKF